MKRMRTFAILLLMGLLSIPALTSCTNDDESGTGTQEQRLVTFTVDDGTSLLSDSLPSSPRDSVEPVDSGFITRSTENGTFENGDAIGVFAYLKGTSQARFVNMKYVYNAGSHTFAPQDESHQISVGLDEVYNYYAYYPYKTGATTELDFSILSDQSSDLSKSDLMLARKENNSQGSTSVALAFEHKMSFLRINLSNTLQADNVTYKESFISSKSSGGKLNLLTGVFTPNTSSLSVKPKHQGSTITCIVPAQRFAALEFMGKITMSNASTRDIKLDKAINLASGKQHLINLNEERVVYGDWATASVSVTQADATQSLDACGTKTVALKSISHQQRDVKTYLNNTLVKSVTEFRDVDVSSSTSYHLDNSSAFSLTTARAVSAKENTSASTRSVSVTGVFEGKSGVLVLTQPAATFSGGNETLTSIALSGTGSVDACGGSGVTGLTCTATYTTSAKKTACGTQVAAATTRTAAVTPTYTSIAENTSTAAKTVTATASFGGKTATRSVSQSAATISGGDESLTSIALSGTGSVAACGGSGVTGLTCTATYTTSAKKTACGTQVAAATTRTANVTPTYASIAENTAASTKTVTATASFDGKTTTKSITQSAATISGGNETLTSIALSGSGTIGACGGTGVSGLTCTATYSVSAKTTSCGTLVAAATTRTANVTPTYTNISENTATSSRSVTATASFGGKTATKSITQSAATRSGGSTTWSSTNASISASTTSVSSAGGSVTLSNNPPTYSTTAVTTSCGTTVTAASSGNATCSYSITSNGAGATLSGSTVTFPGNSTSSSRSVTVRATFSNGTTKDVTITQNRGWYVGD